MCFLEIFLKSFHGARLLHRTYGTILGPSVHWKIFQVSLNLAATPAGSHARLKLYPQGVVVKEEVGLILHSKPFSFLRSESISCAP